MLNKLFSSQVLFDVLNYLFENKECVLNTSEIIKHTKRKQVNVMRELDKLTKLGIVQKNKKNNHNFYKLNKNYPHFSILEQLFHSTSNDKNKKYILMAEEGSVALLGLNYFYRGYSSGIAVEHGLLTNPVRMIAHHKGDYAWFYFEKSVVEKGIKETLDKLLSDPSFVRNIIFSKTVSLGEEALNIFRNLIVKNYEISSTEINNLLDKFSKIIVGQIGLNTPAVFDLYGYPYSNYLKKYLDIHLKNKKISVSVAMEKLLQPDELTFTQKLHLEILSLALWSKSTRGDYQEKLKSIHSNWLWINFGYRGPVMEKNLFEEMLKAELKKSLSEIKAEIYKLENYKPLIAEEKNKIFKDLKIDLKHRRFIEALSLLSLLKVYRKDISFLLIFLTYKLTMPFKGDFSDNDICWFTLREVKKLVNGEIPVKRDELKKRMIESAVIGIEDGKIYTGKAAKEIVDKTVIRSNDFFEDKRQEVKLLEGTTACLGSTGDWVYGKVKIVNSSSEMSKLEEGDILVSIATIPDIVPAMKRAGAIVTDHGGITSHAAIVSRELNKPCLIGTKYATKLFKDGDDVVVCPRHGYIKFQ